MEGGCSGACDKEGDDGPFTVLPDEVLEVVLLGGESLVELVHAFLWRTVCVRWRRVVTPRVLRSRRCMVAYGYIRPLSRLPHLEHLQVTCPRLLPIDARCRIVEATLAPGLLRSQEPDCAASWESEPKLSLDERWLLDGHSSRSDASGLPMRLFSDWGSHWQTIPSSSTREFWVAVFRLYPVQAFPQSLFVTSPPPQMRLLSPCALACDVHRMDLLVEFIRRGCWCHEHRKLWLRAARKNRVDIVRIALREDATTDEEWLSGAAHEAAIEGALEVVELICGSALHDPDPSTLARIAREDGRGARIVLCVVARSPHLLTFHTAMRICRRAAASGDIETLSRCWSIVKARGWRWQRGSPFPTFHVESASVADVAAHSGHVDVLRFLLGEGHPIGARVAMMACVADMVHVMEWLETLPGWEPSPRLFTTAAVGGSRRSAEWLLERGIEWHPRTTGYALWAETGDFLRWARSRGAPWWEDGNFLYRLRAAVDGLGDADDDSDTCCMRWATLLQERCPRTDAELQTMVVPPQTGAIRELLLSKEVAVRALFGRARS